MVWLPLIHEILGNICIPIVCQPDFDVMNFKINLIFLIKPFFYRTKKPWKNLTILRMKRAFWDKIKSIFSSFLKAFNEANNAIFGGRLEFNFSLSLKKARSSHRSSSIEKAALKNVAKFTGKHLCQSIFFSKVAGLFYRKPPCDCFWIILFRINLLN